MKFGVLRSKKTMPFILLLVSSVGFSLSLIFVRFYGGNAELVYLINYQSLLVFLSFLLQLGFRACLRYEYFKNHKKIVVIADASLLFLLTMLSCLSLFLHLWGLNFYFATASLLAVLTLRQGLAVAANDIIGQTKYASLVFLLCISGSVLVFLPVGDKLKDLLVEFISTASLGWFVYICTARFSTLLRRKKLFVQLILKSQGFQLGAGVGYFFGFILAQTMIDRFSSSDVIQSFADAQLVAGVVSLFAGKFIMLVESRFYSKETNNLSVFSLLILIWLMTALLISGALSFYHDVSFFLLFSISSILLSRFLVGFFVQYISGRRGLLYMFLFGVLLVQLGIFYLKSSVFIQYGLAVLVVFAGLHFMRKDRSHVG